MKHCHLFITLLSLLLLPPILHAQSIQFRANASFGKVMKTATDTMKHPWAGGMANAQYSKIDMNGDGLDDMFVFDHVDSTITTYLFDSVTKGYRYAPEYAAIFPELKVWAFLVDYNRDSLPDIFAYAHLYGGGLEVYKNIGKKGAPKFKMTTSYLNTIKGCFTPAQVFVNQVSMPGFGDVDGDGDLDIIGIDNSGYYASYYKNRCADSFGTNYAKYDSLYFDLVDDVWGFFGGVGGAKNLPDSFIHPPQIGVDYGTHCLKNKHAGGHITLLNKDGDKDMDLVYSDINGAGFSCLENGKFKNAVKKSKFDTIVSIDTNYLKTIVPYFPAGSFVDVDNDGIRDFLAAPMDFVNTSASINSSDYFHNNGTDNQPSFVEVQKDFLQEDMIDLGSGAAPAFADINGDKIPEYMYIATRGNIGKPYQGSERIVKYKNISAVKGAPVFLKVNDDFLNLSAKGMSGIIPSVSDLNKDGIADMLIGQFNGKLKFYLGESTGPGDTMKAFSIPSLDSVDVGNLSTPSFGDLDGDGLTDLVIGNLAGSIAYYKNMGLINISGKMLPRFKLITDVLGGISTKDTNAYVAGGASPVIADFNYNGKPDLLSGSGRSILSLYLDISNNLSGTFTPEVNLYYNKLLGTTLDAHLGAFTYPAATWLDSDAYPDIVVGNDKGGLQSFVTMAGMVSVDEKASQGQKEISIYPNPASKFITIKAKAGSMKVELFTVLGQSAGRYTLPDFSGEARLDLSNISKGMYLIRLVGEDGVPNTKTLFLE